MLKFAKYFFIVFVITAILPLLLMFAWNNTQIGKFRSVMSKSALTAGKSKLESAFDSTLKIQEGDILAKLYFIEDNDKNLTTIKRILKDYNIEILQTPAKKLESYYENDGKTLYACTVLPFDNSTKGLKISKEIDITLLRPTGPYNIELRYDKNKAAVKKLIMDPLAPSFTNKSLKVRIEDRLFMQSYRKKLSDSLVLKNEKGEPSAFVYIYLAFNPYHGFLDNLLTGIIILLIGIISSFIIGLIVDKNFVRPLMGLSLATKEIKKGNFSFKIETCAKSKMIRNIISNFNAMVQNLDAKEKLRQSFISNLTHDLRTPLVSQAQSLEFISDKFKEIGLQNEYELAQSLAKNNEHLLTMVNLILESYCFDPSKLQLKKESTNLYEIVQGCEKKLKPLIDDKNLEFINAIDKNFMINADVFQLTRVFLNLLSNAIENTSENKFIKTDAQLAKTHISITIEDNGNGISPEDLKFIFERYYSGKSLERKLGSGFGLSVCEKLIEMHGGTIKAESEMNKFTRFTIKLPL